MAVVTRAYSETDGSVAEASSVNRVIDDLYDEMNGKLNSANIAASGVGAPNYENESIQARALGPSAELWILAFGKG